MTNEYRLSRIESKAPPPPGPVRVSRRFTLKDGVYREHGSSSPTTLEAIDDWRQGATEREERVAVIRRIVSPGGPI